MSANPTITEDNGIVRDERGLSAVEYVIVLVLIAAASVGIWQLLGNTVKSKLNDAYVTIREMNGNGQTSQSQSNGLGQSNSRPQPQASKSNAPATPTPGRAAGKVDD